MRLTMQLLLQWLSTNNYFAFFHILGFLSVLCVKFISRLQNFWLCLASQTNTDILSSTGLYFQTFNLSSTFIQPLVIKVLTLWGVWEGQCCRNVVLHWLFYI